MQFMVLFEAFDTIATVPEIKRLREAVGKQIECAMASGKVVAGGIFADRRGGFLLLDRIGSAEELMNLLGGGLLDHFHVETHPVYSFDKLKEFFKKNPVI